MKSKKILALILSVVMVAWQMPTFVFAQEEDKDSVPEETTSQEILEDDGDVNEDDRAEDPADETEAEPEAEDEADPEIEEEAQAELFNEIVEADDAFLISSEADWNTFCNKVNNGSASYSKPYVLNADITVTEKTAGLSNHPFEGVFDGDGHTLTFNVSSAQEGSAPFRYIQTATIKNLTVDGNCSGGIHSAGLVGFNLSGESMIENIEVKSSVTNNSASGSGYVGGVLGHNRSASVTMTKVTFSGTIDNANDFAGGLIGWSDSSTVNMNDCVFDGTYVGSANFHPVMCKAAIGYINGTFADVYYFAAANNTGNNTVLDSGVKVSASVPEDGFYKEATVRGKQCYADDTTTVSVSLASSSLIMVSGLNVDNVRVSVKYGNNTVDASDYTYIITDSNGDAVASGTQLDAGVYTVTATPTESSGFSGSATGTFNIRQMLPGSGTADEPYLIYTAEDWETFAYLVDVGDIDKPYHGAHYKLMEDITVTTQTGKASSDCFRGKFYGNNKTLTVNLSGKDHVAPFGMTIGATIRDLNVEGTINASGQFAAGLVGEINRAGNGSVKTSIINCAVNVTINSTVKGDSCHAGIAGRVTKTEAEIKDCAFTGKIIGSDSSHCGGIVGYFDSYSEKYLSFVNDIFAPSGIDLKDDSNCTIVRSSDYDARYIKYDHVYYLTGLGTVQGASAYGTAPSDILTYKKTICGVEFYASGNASLTVEGTPYSRTGEAIAVTPVVKFDGEVISDENYTITIHDSDDQVVGTVTEVGDYTLTVTGNESGGYYGSVSAPFAVIPSLDGEGTEASPYIIHNADEWIIAADKINNGMDTDAYYKLSDDFDNTAAVTVPIGTEVSPFAGSFDGNGKTLNVNISDTSLTGAAPFGYIAGASIHDLTVTGSVTGSTHSAGLVGFCWSGENTISDCIVSVDVTGGSYIGGIVGHGKSSVLNVSGCIYNGTLVSASERAAGIVGWMDAATIDLSNCLFAGTNSTTHQFHPIALKNGGSTVNKTITDCYYLTDPTTTSGNYVLGPTIGLKVTEAKPEAGAVIYKTVTAVDGNDYYAVFGTVNGLRSDYYSSTGLDIDYTVGNPGMDPLEADTDYTVKLTRDGDEVDSVSGPGSYVITASGIGDYGGSASFAFVVEESVKYMDYNVTTGEFSEADAPYDIIKITSSMTDWNGGWYFVDGNVTISGRVNISGSHVHLILKDGSSLTCSNGISVGSYKDFTVYGQKNGTGSLTCKISSTVLDYYGCAAIGGYKGLQNYGHITINGGRVTANSNRPGQLSNPAAGIGAGMWDGGHGADNSGSVTINGGTVNATGGSSGSAGLGGGFQSNAGTITIRGGNVTATGSNGNGIGRATTIDWTQGNYDATIIFTWNDADTRIKTNGYLGNLTLQKYFKAGSVIYKGNMNDDQKNALKNQTLIPCDAYSVTYKSGMDHGDDHVILNEGTSLTLPPVDDYYLRPEGMEFMGWQIGDDPAIIEQAGTEIVLTGDTVITATWGQPTVSYVDAKGNDMDPVVCYPLSSATTELDANASTWFAVTRDTSIESRIVVNGDVNLILADDVVLSAPGGISVSEGNSLTIWCQKDGTGGIIIDRVSSQYAGIGGDNPGDSIIGSGCGSIIINGGVISVKAGSSAAAIGGGYHSDGSGYIEINGGNIYALSVKFGGGAAIGGGYEGKTGTIVITGGEITAESYEGAGIGSGLRAGDYELSKAPEIRISGGNITANSTDGSGIGGGMEAGNLAISITGGHISASRIGDGKSYSSTRKKSTVTFDWSIVDPDMSVLSQDYACKDSVVTLNNSFITDGGQILPTGNVGTGSIAGKTLTPYGDTRIAGHSLTLDGKIGVNFHVFVPKGTEPGTMTFEISGKGGITAKDGYVQKDGYYVYTCYVDSIQMADTITAVYDDGNGTVLEEEYSVAEYLAYFDQHEAEYGAKTIALIKSLADYGHYVQPYLAAVNGWALGTDYEAMSSYYTQEYDINAIKDELKNVSVSASVEGSGLTGVSYYLQLESATELVVTLKGDDIDLSECGYDHEATDNGGYKVRIGNISAADLDKNVTVEGTATGAFSITLSPLCYINAVMNGSSYTDDARNAMAAMYNYYKAAKAYIG